MDKSLTNVIFGTLVGMYGCNGCLEPTYEEPTVKEVEIRGVLYLVNSLLMGEETLMDLTIY